MTKATKDFFHFGEIKISLFCVFSKKNIFYFYIFRKKLKKNIFFEKTQNNDSEMEKEYSGNGLKIIYYIQT